MRPYSSLSDSICIVLLARLRTRGSLRAPAVSVRGEYMLALHSPAPTLVSHRCILALWFTCIHHVKHQPCARKNPCSTVCSCAASPKLSINLHLMTACRKGKLPSQIDTEVGWCVGCVRVIAALSPSQSTTQLKTNNTA